MPLVHGDSQAAVDENIHRLVHQDKKPPNQAVAIALNVAREHRAAGGFNPAAVENHLPVTKPKAGVLHTGPIRSPVAGRTDRLPMRVRSNSYVLPADVVSGLGENNTEAGHRTIENIFAKAPKLAHGGSVGGDDDGVEIVAAGGEHVLSPEEVAYAGGGDVKKGHDVLDKFVKKVRNTNIKTLKRLPGPVKG